MNLSLYGITWISLFFWVGIGFVWGILANDVYKYYSEQEKTKTAMFAIAGILSFTLIFVLLAGDIPTFFSIFSAGVGIVLSLSRRKIVLLLKREPRLPKKAIRVLH